jgi:3-oxoadipate enol-lactonase
VTLGSGAAPAAEGKARTRAGASLGYSLYGSGDAKQRAVLVHSLAMDRDFWRPVAERLAPRAAVLIYDCRGHGKSDKPTGSYTVEGFADDLADLLDHMGWDAALAVGASMGGCVALAFAAAYPKRACALGLFDTTAWYGADAPKQWEDRAQKALAGGLDNMVEFQTTRWFSDAFRAQHPEIVRHCVEVFLRNDLPSYAASCRMLGACDLRAKLPGMNLPAAVLVGEEDYAAPPAMAEALHRGIAGSSLTVIKGARHLTPLEVPDQAASSLARLLDQAAAR